MAETKTKRHTYEYITSMHAGWFCESTRLKCKFPQEERKNES